MNKAIFAGSFDPFTLGHKDVLYRCSSMFDEVIIAVAKDNMKSSAAMDERMEVIFQSVAGISNVTVVSFGGLLTDFMKHMGVKHLIRGVRNSVDYEYERSLFECYRTQMPEIEFVLVPAKNEFLHISSTVVRELVKLGGDIDGYVENNAKDSIIKIYKEL